MSIEMVRRAKAVRHPDVRGSVRLVLFCLAENANKDDVAYPGEARLAADAAITTRQVRRALATLRELGFIRDVEGGLGRGNVTKYLLALSEKGDIYDTVKEDICDIATRKEDIYDTAKADICDTKADIYDIKADIGSHTREEPLEPSEPLAEEPGIIGVPPMPPSTGTSAPARVEAVLADGTWDEWLEALCWVCHEHKEVGALTERQLGALTAEAKIMRKAGTTREHLRRWWQSVWLSDWRWRKDRQRPLPSDVRASIPAVRQEMAAGLAIMADSVSARPSTMTTPDTAEPSARDEPWARLVRELSRSLQGNEMVQAWLASSRLVDAGEVEGVPLYRVELPDPAGVGWIRDRLGPRLRREVSTMLGAKVLVEVAHG